MDRIHIPERLHPSSRIGDASQIAWAKRSRVVVKTWRPRLRQHLKPRLRRMTKLINWRSLP